MNEPHHHKSQRPDSSPLALMLAAGVVMALSSAASAGPDLSMTGSEPIDEIPQFVTTDTPALSGADLLAASSGMLAPNLSPPADDEGEDHADSDDDDDDDDHSDDDDHDDDDDHNQHADDDDHDDDDDDHDDDDDDHDDDDDDHDDDDDDHDDDDDDHDDDDDDHDDDDDDYDDDDDGADDGSAQSDDGDGGNAGNDEADDDGNDEANTGADDNLPATRVLECTIRDFRPAQWSGGHPDFESFGGTTTVGLVAEFLNEDGNPVSSGDLRGMKIQAEYLDSQGRNINPAMYDPSLGDVEGVLVPGPSSNGLTSAERFDQWYRDVPGVNLSKNIELTLTLIPGTNRYVFDSSIDVEHGTHGFFPINGELYGDFRDGRNYHFTTEINTIFTYQRNTGQVFKFTGDDDVWVYIDGRLVVDLGGLHPKREQFLDLDRLDWLTDGRTYTLDIFHAERRYSGSNFRIETSIPMRNVEMPPTAALYD